MMSQPKKERRSTRRVATSLGARLTGLGGEPIEAHALNLSAGGIYVTTPRYVTPFSKVELTLVLPPFGQVTSGQVRNGRHGRNGPGGPAEVAANRGGEPEVTGEETTIRAEGIVVRCEPDPQLAEQYSLAIAFLHLTPADRNRIEGYVNWRLERSLIESAEA
jgi:hypothetical protein